MPRALKPAPDLEILEGALPADGWATPTLALEIAAWPEDRTVTVQIVNPHEGPAYLRNRIEVKMDGEAVFGDLLFAGHGVRIERFVPARAALLIELASEASMALDPLDNRSRGVRLALSQTAA